MAKQSEKGARYLSLLDDARCHGKWTEIPELARKVEKHAPSRKCLACTARAEAQIAKQPSKRPATGVRPTTETTANPLLHVARELESAIALENQYPEDAYQAKTSLSWLYWNYGDYALAKSNVPHTLPSAEDGKIGKLMGWTYVCMVKAAFIRGSSEEAIGKRENIHAVYESCLQSLEPLPPSFTASPEYNFWWERFYSRCAGCFYGFFQENVRSKKKAPNPRLCLTAFRSWAKHWGSSQGATIDTRSDAALRKSTQRSLVWKSYYDLLSEILRLDLPSHPVQSVQYSHDPKEPSPNHRSLQYLELKKVEAVYESILLRDVPFPEASKVNREVDEWVDTVMSNWSILCGPEWQDQDLGEGGQAGVGRNALDILYRAATRTFHSTAVLRHLFTVHASLAEFELAEKALDSYLEIVGKGKARVEKSGHAEPGLDSDEVMLQTICAGVEMLCESGKRKQVQKSTVLAKQLEQWLLKHGGHSPVAQEGQTQHEANTAVSMQILTGVYKATATSKASWARLTYETPTRAQLQAEAISQFRDALRCDHAAEEDPSILYALALALAETRDVEGAITAIKQALASESRTFTEPIDQQSFVASLRTRVTRSAPLVECWHLLALLLSSRQEFETAEVACQTALEGAEPFRGSSRNSIEVTSGMSFFEKQQLVEAKMTQVALVEINEGTESAVNTGSELLALYTKFFDNPTSKPPPTAKTSIPPPTATGSVRSFRGSIFGRNKEGRGREGNPALSLRSGRLSGGVSRTPTISVTDSSRAQPSQESSRTVTRHGSGKLQKRASRRSVKQSRTVSPARSQAQVTLASKATTPPRSTPAQTATESMPTTPRATPAKDTSARGTPARDTPVKDGQPKEALTNHAESPEIQSKSTLPSMSNGDQPNGIQNHIRPETATSHDPSEVGIAVSHDLRASVSAQFDPLSAPPSVPPLDLKTEPRQEPQPEYDFLPRVQAPPKTSVYIPAPLFSVSENHRFALSLLQRIWLFIAALYRRASMLEDARGAIDEAWKQAKLVEIAVAANGPAGVKDFEEAGWSGIRSVEETWADVYAEMGHLCLAEGDPYEAMIKYDGALTHCVDHSAASVGLANILLDIYTQKIPLQQKKPSLAGDPKPRASENETTMPVFPKFLTAQSLDRGTVGEGASVVADGDFLSESDDHPAGNLKEDPEALDRLAARDRAYGLLSALTKLGQGWDDSEAWFALARAYEESGQAEKAKEILWWVVELEEKRPVRHWRCLGEGYKLRH